MNVKCKDVKSKPQEFWSMIKPLLSDKSKSTEAIKLLEDGTFIDKPKELAEFFNHKFSTIADEIGKSSAYVNDISNHPSLTRISRHMANVHAPEFHFESTTVDTINKCLKRLNPNKATGYDGISPKVLQMSHDVMAPILCNLINNVIKYNHFPKPLKYAELSPIYKAKSRLSWQNFRPVSVLACISKVVETIMVSQMQNHLGQIYSIYLSAYRSMIGCHSVLIHTTEVWKQALDSGKYVGVIMSDLSKAFDCLPHNLMLEKMKHYKFSLDAVKLLESYITNRFQRVKIGQDVSSWMELCKGVPQGSNVGPQCFNLYINDLLLELADQNIVPSNYADDNTCTVIGDTQEQTLTKVKDTITILVNWFDNNMMKANVDKFQFLLLTPRDTKDPVVVNINNTPLTSQDDAKLLGVYIDKNLNFNKHVLEKCKKANAKLQVLRRLVSYLTEDCKLAILRSFVVSHFIYCSPLLHFSGKLYRNKMERILYRGLRFTFNDYESSYDKLLEKAKMCTIENMREKAIIVEMYKCLHGLGPKYLSEIFKICKSTSRKGPIFVLPRVKTTRYGLHSLRFHGPKIWNDLSTKIKEAPSVDSLKMSLSKYTGAPCKCRQCRQ